MPPPSSSTDAPSFLLVANNSSLDFVNTLLAGDAGSPVELLDSPEALGSWCAASGLFDTAALRRLRAAGNSPKAGAAVLAEALALRTALGNIVHRAIEGKPYADAAAKTLAPYLERMPFRRLANVENGRLRASLHVDDTISPADELLGTIANSALDLFVSAEPEHLRKCAHPGCVVVFHDTTKNHRRQWCSMTVCGNRAKATRFRERQGEK